MSKAFDEASFYEMFDELYKTKFEFTITPDPREPFKPDYLSIILNIKNITDELLHYMKVQFSY